MPIYPRGGTFMVSVGSGKDRIRKPAKTRAEAEVLEAELILQRKQAQQNGSGSPQEAAQGTAKAKPEATPGKTIQDAFRLTLRLHWKGTKAEATAYKNGNACVQALGPETLLTDIGPEQINEMLFEFEDQGNGGSTINRKMSAFSMLMKTALDQGWIKALPKVPRRREGAHRIRWMDEAEEAKVLAMCDHLGLPDLRDFIIVAIDTGFRRSELLRFKTKDFSNGLLHLHAGTTKTDEARAVPATKRVTEILVRRGNLERPFEAINGHTLRWQWDKLRELMKLTDDPQFVVHMLRHTCASRLVQRGVPLVVVKTWMGHKTIATTMRYAHLAPENLNVALKALEGVLGAPIAAPAKALEMADADF